MINVSYRVHFYDTDTMGVVHHSNYIRWFEIGRVEFLRTKNITLNDLMNANILFPITSVNAKYHSPAHFDDVVTIETTPTALTKVKMEFDYRILRGETLLVSGHSQNVFTDMSTGKIIRLPDKFFRLLSNQLA